MPTIWLRWIFILTFIFSGIGEAVFAQVAPPPPAPQGGFPQPESPRKMWTWGFNAGMIGYSPHRMEILSGNNHFRRTTNFGAGVVRDNEGKRHFSIMANTSLGLHGGIMLGNKKGTQFSTIEAQFQSNKACYSFDVPFFFTFQGDTFAKWIMTDKYFCYGLSYQHSFNTSGTGFMGNAAYMYVRGTFSQTFYHRNFDVLIYEGRYEDWTQSGTGMTARTIAASKSSYMLSFEAGRRNFMQDFDRTFDIGVAVHIPFTHTYTDQYEFTQSNASVGKSNVTYTGATVMLNMRFTFNYAWKQRERDTAIPPPDIYANTDTTRDIDVQGTVTVHRKRVTILVWDRNEVDGDIVSLFMNNEMVEHNLKLKKRKRRIRVKLNPGVNTLVMYAENLGEIPPNTAAIQVKEGRHKRNVNLVSDNGKSGAIEIVYEPR